MQYIKLKVGAPVFKVREAYSCGGGGSNLHSAYIKGTCTYIYKYIYMYEVGIFNVLSLCNTKILTLFIPTHTLYMVSINNHLHI